jgi:hypothetical protein
MGLDMYLTKKIYVGGNYEHNNVTGKISIKRNGNPIKIDLSKVTYIILDAGYWRKANQIHNWFVKNVQDGVDNCGEYYVESGKLEELLGVCKEIKAKCSLTPGKIRNGQTSGADGKWVDIMEDGNLMENSSVAAELLPSASGFFFGSTDYDEYYLQDIENTIEIIENVLADKEPSDIYYHSSW